MALLRSSNQDELQEMISRDAGLMNRTNPAPMPKGTVPAKR